MIRILFIDDDPLAHKTLKMILPPEYSVVSTLTGREGIRTTSEESVDIVLLDINLPDVDGIYVLQEIVSLPACPPVIMLTALSDISLVVKAMQCGAYDYIVKPYDLKQLEGTLRRTVQNLPKRHHFLPDSHHTFLDKIVGESRPIRAVKELLVRYAASDSPVFVSGESGTGKELVAWAVHALSKRIDFPFVPVNCGAVPETLLESELFGHEKGAYTDAVNKAGFFEQSDKGTIFLDEIAELSPSAQVKLLRVIEAKELTRVGGTRPIPLNIRIVSATNKHLRDEIRTGRFREDLFYRIGVLLIKTPALRHRKEDIPILAAHYLHNELKSNSTIARDALGKLQSHNWPGNIRELRNVLERATLLSGDRMIRAKDITF